MTTESYTLTPIALAGLLLCVFFLGIVAAYLAMFVVAGARQSRRDAARIRAWARDARAVQDELAPRRGDRRTLRPYVGPRGAA